MKWEDSTIRKLKIKSEKLKVDMKTIRQVSAGGIVYKKIYDLRSKICHLQWLICQHSQHKGWVFPKGLVGSSESMEQAALREVEEEGGVKARIVNDKPIKTFYSYRFGDSLIRKTVYYFLMEYISGDPVNHDWEMSEAKFISEKEIKKTLSYNSDRLAYKKALDFLK